MRFDERPSGLLQAEDGVSLPARLRCPLQEAKAPGKCNLRRWRNAASTSASFRRPRSRRQRSPSVTSVPFSRSAISSTAYNRKRPLGFKEVLCAIVGLRVSVNRRQ